MASFYDLTVGQETEFRRVIAQAGLDAEIAIAIKNDPSLARLAVEAVKAKLAEQHLRLTTLFTPPGEQIELVQGWSLEKNWGFSTGEFAEIEKSIPAIPEEPTVAVVLVPYLEDVWKTFFGLWEIARSRQEKYWEWDGYTNPENLRLLPGIEHSAETLRWEVIDLGANCGKAPKDIRSPSTSPHAGILASAALHPQWVQAMDGDKVPYVWAPGYEVTGPGKDPWPDAPCLGFDRSSRRASLSYDWYGHRDDGWAVPSLRECRR